MATKRTNRGIASFAGLLVAGVGGQFVPESTISTPWRYLVGFAVVLAVTYGLTPIIGLFRGEAEGDRPRETARGSTVSK